MLGLMHFDPALNVLLSQASLVSGDTIPFGPVGSGTGGTYKELVFTILNSGLKSLAISSVSIVPTGNYTVQTALPLDVGILSQAPLIVRYTPTANLAASAILTITNNDTTNSSFVLNLNGNGVDVGTGLTAYYPLNGNFNDSSGNGSNGTPVGSMSFTTDRAGLPGAAAFDGSGSNYIQSTLSTGWTYNSTFSLCAWVQSSQSSFSLLARPQFGLNTAQLEFGYNSPNFQISRDDFSNTGWTFTTIAGSSAVGQWQHLAYVSNGGNVSVYLNGVFVGSSALSNNGFPANSNPILLFGFGFFLLPLSGAMDDVHIYDTTALSPAQVLALYNQN